MPQGLQASRDPFTLGRGLEEDAGARSLPEYFRKAARLRPDPALDQFAPLGQDADLTFLLVHVDANMVHGWPPSPCACERVISLWGTLCHHVEWGVSRFIPSILILLSRIIPF